MSFFFAGAGTRVQSASAATLTPAFTMPAGVPSGVRLAVVQVKNNDVITTATLGWAKIDQQNSGAGLTAALFIGEAGAANPVFTWATAAACGALQWAYGCGFGVVETSIWGALSFAVGAANPHTSPSITTTRDRSLVVYADAGVANTALAAPAGWTEDFDNGSAVDVGRTTVGSKRLDTSGSASGNISVTGSAGAWVQFQVEILTTLPPPGLTLAEEEVAAWVAPDGGLAIAEEEITLWVGDPGLVVAEEEIVGWIGEPGLTVAEEEIVLWLGEAPPPVLNRRRQTYNN